jgi:non-homologous end joining protein Ku
MIKKLVKKNGDISVKEYNQKKYNDTYYEKNKDKIKEKITCEICNKSFLKSNKSNHYSSKQHILIENIKNSIKNVL